MLVPSMMFIIYIVVISFLDTKKGANQFHSVLKVLDYLYTKNENQLTPMGDIAHHPTKAGRIQ